MKDQEETENMEEPRIDKTIYTGRPENTIFWTVWELNIRG